MVGWDPLLPSSPLPLLSSPPLASPPSSRPPGEVARTPREEKRFAL